jgi:type VI secretion system protein ImpC
MTDTPTNTQTNITPPPPVPADALLKDIVDIGKLRKLPKEKTPTAFSDADTAAIKLAQGMVDDYRSNLPSPEEVDKKHSVIQVLQEQIEKIDGQLSAFLSAILHDEDFQKLEASWRGLRYLVFNTDTSTKLKLRVLSVKRDTLQDDLTQAIDKDQSALFKKVYEEEYGTYGGNPFSLLIGDFYFGREPKDFELLNNIASVAAAAHTPFIAAASPKLFNMDSFEQLGDPRDMSKIFETTDLIKWRSFRESDDARYVTLTLPRFLLRLPYGESLKKVNKFKMKEIVDVGDDAYVAPPEKQIDPETGQEIKPLPVDKQHTKYLWGNAAYALGVRITTAFARYAWCAAIRGPEGGGKVTDLPAHTFDTKEGDKALKCPTEVAITDRRENELNHLGFIALVHRKGEDYAAFFGSQTTHKPKLYDLATANDNAAISARLPYLLAASRFAHYLKVICRDKIGTFQTKETMALFLNRWIMDYVLATDDAGQDVKAQFPLRDARIDVFDVPGKPGAYRAVVFLRPHFQLEELTTSIRLVAELPPPVAA